MRGAGQIVYLARIAEPTVGVITNIGPQHVELLGSVENIAAAKAELLAPLPAAGLAVLPIDDAHFEVLKNYAHCRVVTFGESEDADYRVVGVEPDAAGNTTFEFETPGSSSPIRVVLPLPGRHNARNAAAALAVAVELGMSLQEAVAAIEKAAVPGARMRVVKNATRDITVIDDCYNAGPDSTRAALQVLADFPGAKRRVAVLGAMRELGDWTEAEHRKLGEQVAQIADVVLFVAEETRVAHEVVTSADRSVETDWCADADEAAARVGEIVKSGDVVLVKGSRSIELETVVSALV
jgi:UDP-N-acetylmuramoyl-tripeptide--D-alanyl-D-alanine ligase